MTGASAETLTIMSANLTSGSNQAYESAGIRIFQGLNPDVVLIQEFNYRQGSLRDLVDTAFGPEYSYYLETGDDNIPNGIVSRYPIISSGSWADPNTPDRDFAWAVIDIPGDTHLQVVSVHLLSSSATTRNAQATLLKNLIQGNFELDQYIVVGGDLNTSTRSEAAIATFNSFLNATNHIPADQNGNGNTNEPRAKPYDWVMPNDLLDARHTTLQIGSSSYPQGLVFDSSVYTPLSEVSPVQYGDSHVSGMQHMAVVRAFEIPASASPTATGTTGPSATPTKTPTTGGPSPTPTRTGTTPPQPTWTPTPSSTSTPVPTPTVTPTGAPEDPVVELALSGTMFHPGEAFVLSMTIRNDEIFRRMAQFVVLDVYGLYFFYPGWTQEVDWSVVDLLSTEVREIPVLEFIWPSGAGSASGLKFYGAGTSVIDFSLLSNLAVTEFGYTQ